MGKNLDKTISDLKMLGVTKVECQYNGSGDSGGVESIAFFAGEREVAVPDKVSNRISDLC